MADKANVTILDSSGAPMQHVAPRSAAIAGYGASMGGFGGSPHDSANIYDQRMEGWRPSLLSPDTETNPYRDRIVARSRDLVRNDGWANGGIARIQDNVVGSNFRPLSKPDYRSLAAYTGLKTFDATWAAEYGKILEGHWRAWANDLNRYCDVSRKLTVPQIFRLAFRHKIIDNDCIALLQWLPERIGIGRARYATAILLIDPDRLSNPVYRFDTNTMRGGVVIDHSGVAEAYYIRRAHAGDWYNAQDSLHWDLIPRETDWGRPIVVHDFEHDRASQHRGGAGVLSPILQRLKMIVQYDGSELDAAMINAILGTYIESPFDPELVQSAIGSNEDIGAYQQMRTDFHKQHNVKFGGARIPILAPGEKINAITAARPNSAFESFQSVMLRNVASSLGLSYEQLSADWSKSNYSSARGAILEAWKTITRRKDDFANGFCTPIFSAFTEESHEKDDLPLPSGAPSFNECRTAYSACNWLSPARLAIDGVKEAQASQLGMEAGLTTLQREAMDAGTDWEETLEQRAVEIKRFEELGVPVPSWGRLPDETIASEKIG